MEGSEITSNLTGVEAIAVNLYTLSHYVGIFLGSIMFLVGIKMLITYSKNPNDPRNSLGGVLIIFIGASMLWSLQSSISLVTNTLTNNNHCFVLSKDSEDMSNNINKHNGECFNAKNSEITAELRADFEDKGRGEALGELLAKINVYMKVLQAIALVYFIKGIFLLQSIAKGTGNATYGQALIMIIAASLILDLPNTLEMLINTVKQATAL
ncbi:hypothetical protein [Pseudoalteromonas sp. H105]|uniref:hypothetical protein n=1 Tax=Pseudoalteromonas sp. H105 TaxID=1348393 RepID=UPI0007321E67|nr:hypothetical protein [Pseudoalteromonas sp. H105]KTF12219.1 hypothetical protein ATS75_18435 [Pseudoalteromonas sp. H105]